MPVEPRKTPLRFTHLEMTNWRNFRQADVSLARRVVLVGPNASGKSNFLDAFRFLHDLAAVGGGGFQQAVAQRGGVSRIRSLAARAQPDVALAIHAGSDEQPRQWEYTLAFSQDNNRRPIIKTERILRAGVKVLSRPNEDDKADEQRLTQTHLEQVNVNKEYRPLAELFRSVRYLHLVPHLVRDPSRSVGRKNDPFGGDFLELIGQTNENTRQSRLRKIGEALKAAVPQLSELEWRRDDHGVPHLRGKYEHWRPQGAWQEEADFSDGTLRLIGLLWALLDGTGPLLLEEPELSLHPEVIRFLPQAFARIQRKHGRQVLVSTHSPSLLDDSGLGLDEILMLLPQNEGTVVKQPTDFPEIKALLAGGLTPGEAILPYTSPRGMGQLALFGE